MPANLPIFILSITFCGPNRKLGSPMVNKMWTGYNFQKHHLSLGSRSSEMIRKGEVFTNAKQHRQLLKRWIIKTLGVYWRRDFVYQNELLGEDHEKSSLPQRVSKCYEDLFTQQIFIQHLLCSKHILYIMVSIVNTLKSLP